MFYEKYRFDIIFYGISKTLKKPQSSPFVFFKITISKWNSVLKVITKSFINI